MSPHPHRVSRAIVARGLAALALVVLGAASLLTIRPPPVRPASAPLGEFSAVRAFRHLEAIARAPRPIGSPAHDAARATIEAELAALGLEVEAQPATVALQQAGEGRAARLVNVLGRLRGSGVVRGSVLLASHYDSVPGAPGAGDDGAGVAAVLEVARALRNGPPPASDVVFLFTDAEELGLLGARAFVDEHPWARDVRVAINLEARGSRGASVMWKSSAGNGNLLAALAAAVDRPVATSVVAALGRALPNDTDGTVFEGAGIPSFDFAFAEHLRDYHQPSDDLASLDPRSLQHHGDNALALARFLVAPGAPTSLAGEPIAYFDVLALGVVRMSTRTTRLLAGLAVAAWIVLAARSLRRRRARWSGAAIASGAMIGILVAGAGAALLVGLLAGAVLAPSALGVRSGALGVASVAAGVGVVAGAVAVLRKRVSAEELALGALLVPVAASATLALLAPTTVYVLALPLLGAALASLAASERDFGGAREDAAQPGLDALGTAPAVFFGATSVFTAYVLEGEVLPWLPGVVAALFALFLVPAGARTTMRLGWLAASFGGVAVVGLGAVLLGPRVEAPRASDLAYAVDDRGAAAWLSWAETPDVLVRGILGPDARRGLAPPFTTDFDFPWSAPAPPANVERPEVTVRALGPPSGDVDLTVLAKGARCVKVFGDALDVHIVSVDGRALVPMFRFSPEKDEELLHRVTGRHVRAHLRFEMCGGLEAPLTLRLHLGETAPTPITVVILRDGVPTLPESTAAEKDRAMLAPRRTLVATQVVLGPR